MASAEFGNSSFYDSKPLTLEELGESEHQVGGFHGLRQNEYQIPERLLNKRQYNLPQGTSLKFPYQSLADIVLGANKDVKFHRSLTSRENAQKYATNNRLRLGPDADFNADGVNDVVLFDRYNNPVVINGFALANSEYPYKKAFYEANPKKSQQMRAGGYGKWVRNWIPEHGIDIGTWASAGFKKKSISDREPSLRQNLNTTIKDNIVRLIDGAPFSDEIKKLIKRVLPWFQLFSILYDRYVISALIYMLPVVKENSENVDVFKKLLKRKEVKKIVDTFMEGEAFSRVNAKILSKDVLVGIVNEIAGAGGLDGLVMDIERQRASTGKYPDAIEIQELKEELSDSANLIKRDITARLNQIIRGEVPPSPPAE